MSATQLRPATIFAICLVLGWSAVASAQSYPSKPIHLVVPVAPGGITDVLARALGQKLTEAWGQQVVIENKPAGAGQVGTELGRQSGAGRSHAAGGCRRHLRHQSAYLQQAPV